jgi:hypothetical protein
MKALTLTQPSATLVAPGAKRIETRSWPTSYRGPLAIHAAAGLGPIGGWRAMLRLCSCDPCYRARQPAVRGALKLWEAHGLWYWMSHP